MTQHFKPLPMSQDWARRIVTDPDRAAITPRSVREHAWTMLLVARAAAKAASGDAA